MAIGLINIVVLGIAGMFGEKALINTGGTMAVLTIGVMFGTHSFSIGGIVSWLVALFIGYIIANIKDAQVSKEDNLNYTFTSKDYGFTIQFPSKPLTHQLPAGTEYLSTGKHEVYNVMVSLDYGKYTKAERRNELRSLVFQMSTISAATVLSTIIDETPAGEPATYSVYEVTLENGRKIYRHVRSFFNNENLFTVTASFSQSDEAAFNRFMDSFDLIEAENK